jgi:hypothetical protein
MNCHQLPCLITGGYSISHHPKITMVTGKMLKQGHRVLIRRAESGLPPPIALLQGRAKNLSKKTAEATCSIRLTKDSRL